MHFELSLCTCIRKTLGLVAFSRCFPLFPVSYSFRSLSFLPIPMLIQAHFLVHGLRSTNREPGGEIATASGLLTLQGLVQMQLCLETPAGSDASILNHQLPFGTH